MWTVYEYDDSNMFYFPLPCQHGMAASLGPGTDQPPKESDSQQQCLIVIAVAEYLQSTLEPAQGSLPGLSFANPVEVRASVDRFDDWVEKVLQEAAGLSPAMLQLFPFASLCLSGGRVQMLQSSMLSSVTLCLLLIACHKCLLARVTERGHDSAGAKFFLRYDQDFYGGKMAVKWQGLIERAYPALEIGSVECQLMCINYWPCV